MITQRIDRPVKRGFQSKMNIVRLVTGAFHPDFGGFGGFLGVSCILLDDWKEKYLFHFVTSHKFGAGFLGVLWRNLDTL